MGPTRRQIQASIVRLQSVTTWTKSNPYGKDIPKEGSQSDSSGKMQTINNNKKMHSLH